MSDVGSVRNQAIDKASDNNVTNKNSIARAAKNLHEIIGESSQPRAEAVIKELNEISNGYDALNGRLEQVKKDAYEVGQAM